VTLYSVYEPPSEARDPEDRAEALVFVKEGFSWSAALFALLAWIFGSSDQGQTLFGWLSVALIVLFAFEANDLRRAALKRRGYQQAGTAIGPGRDAAELAFFRSWLPEQEKGRRREPAPGRPSTAGIPAPKASGEAEGVIGLFPTP
jgi:hypothetical protein